MSLMGRTEADGLVTLYDLATGAPVRRWPVDAAECLAGGGWSLDPVEIPVAAEESADDAGATTKAKK